MASIRKLRDGRYQAQYRPVPGGKQITKTTKKKVDAQRWLDEQLASVVTGNFVDPKAGKVSFQTYFGRWAERQLWTTGTQRAMTLAVSCTTFKHLPLNRIQRSHIESWVKHLQTLDRGESRKHGLAPGTIRTRFNNVRSVFQGAVRDRLIAADPSKDVRLPRTRRADVAMTLPTPRQVARLLATASPRFGPFVALCAFAGLRLGEAAALKVSDLDFESGSITVARQVQRENGGGVEIRSPKYGSERTVYVSDELLSLVQVYLETYRPAGKPDRWVFEGSAGDPPHQNTVGYWWRRTRAAAACDDLRLHDLRHFFASGLIAAGCDVVTVQRALGHSSATVTLNTYAHLWPSAEDRTRLASARLFVDVVGCPDEQVTNERAA
ncbi:integrase [Prauserella marina]|uniref:Site-specific recombinase XerD n=1 Tax=Prauserella marina TaxID=530584 RepID=A0A222VVR0_9PSEU|nr:site-specific integrase [Prauserella marina]ASR37970.1 integrase [Prauserella marina]PWV73195.1 site-specific recombinase XerD [Prauserella marina]SDD69628.1 Site-specific recombinase XerD [Prauserella marina]